MGDIFLLTWYLCCVLIHVHLGRLSVYSLSHDDQVGCLFDIICGAILVFSVWDLLYDFLLDLFSVTFATDSAGFHAKRCCTSALDHKGLSC